MANYNLIESTKNAELVTGTSNSDSIIIGGNNVTVNASGGGDIIRLNGGKETTSVNGGKYDSTIWEDTDITNFVYGEGGNDSIYFNQSHANANGGAGNDYFYFGQNRNDITITGGTGKDTVEINLVDNLEVVVTDFSNDDALFINEYTYSYNRPIYYYSDSNSTRRVITQRVENGNVIISDNSSITSSGNNTVSKNITPKFSITLQGVSDISEVADAEYFIYDNGYNKKFTKHSTLGELFGVESSGSKTSTNIDEKPEDKDSTTTTTKPTTTTTETTTNKTTTTTEIETTTNKTTTTTEIETATTKTTTTTGTETTTTKPTTTTSTSTPTVASGSGSGDTIINNNYNYYGDYYGNYYDVSKNNGTIVNQSSVEGGVTNNTSVDNSTTIIRYGNIYTYNGGNKTINDYVEGQVVELKSDYKGIDVNGNSFLVKSSSGDLSIQNSRDKFIGYSASNSEVVAYSYLASGGGQIDGRGKSQAEIMIGGDNANNQIFAGSGGSSLWGGNGGTDTMTGGEGYDEFFFAMGSGNDVVKNASDNDVVNLLGVSLSQISSFSYDSSSVDLNFNNGEHLKVESTSSVGYRVENQTFYFNRATNQWANK